ncbi:hypothetical protein HJC23_013551 [Cyclotella cryptica]|uniref:Uncharacterized protein n=1 Tax=Cyclotella cryptica TaxID=29204 RepID=A0ABD3P5K5_9STRA|eukprot:CCRYP_017352-RA/>CCRYP_017352-RA protein AED:0.05 eAED:0.05 QI:106/1/1/1/1/1/2/171/436
MIKHDKLQILTLLLLLGSGANGFMSPTPTSLVVPPARISTTPTTTTTTTTKQQYRSLGSISSSTRSRRHHRNGKSSSTSLYFLGTDGGILGVGAPEVAVTLVVGYFILGPSELYKLVKEIGKFIQNFRTLGAEATKSFEATMENQLELTELRKAQRELNEAFSFRRSINTDEYAEAFDEGLFSREGGEGDAAAVLSTTATAAAGTGATVSGGTLTEDQGGTSSTKKKKRKLVRRKKKMVVEEDTLPAPTKDLLTEYPDLDLLDREVPSSSSTTTTMSTTDEEATLRAQRLERLGGGESTTTAAATPSEPDWFTASEQDIASQILNPKPTPNPLETFESNRFQSQLSAAEWNAQIMANEDKLSPLSMVMKRLAILEEEKQAADRRLEEEYQRRMDNEDKYYLEKRRVLEDAIGEIQEEVYGSGVERSVEKSEGPKFS